MRVVLALLGLVGLVAAGFMIARAMFPPEPVTAAKQTGEGAPRSQKPQRVKVTISRTRRGERRVTPHATLLPAPVVAALSGPVPPATDKSQMPDLPASGGAPVRSVPMPSAKSAGQPTQKPGPSPGEGSGRQASVPKAAQPTPAPSAKRQTGEQLRSQYRLPYAKATQPSPGDQPRQAGAGVKHESSRYRRVIPESPGVVKTASRKIHFAGVEALAHDAQCTLPSGKTWPCGRIGTLSLRRLIRSRSIVCDILEHLDDISVLARCTVARVDINRWVVRNGWARPAEDSLAEFTEAFDAAQREKKGQWREASPVNN